MDKLKLEGPRQPFVEGIGSLEAARMDLGGIELGGGAEFLDAHRRDGQLLAREHGQEVEAVAAEHPHPQRKVCGRNLFAEHFRHMADELVHVVVRLVYIVENVVPLGYIVYHVFYECNDIAYVCHGLAVLARADHEEPPGRNLSEKVIDIPAVALAEDDCGADDVYVPPRMRLIPAFKHLFGLPFGLSVVVERVFGMVLVRVLLVESIDGNRREEDDAPYSVLLHCPQRHLHAADIGLIIKRCWCHVVAVLCSQQYHKVGTRKLAVHLLLLAHVAYDSEVVEEMAREKVNVLAFVSIPARL